MADFHCLQRGKNTPFLMGHFVEFLIILEKAPLKKGRFCPYVRPNEKNP